MNLRRRALVNTLTGRKERSHEFNSTALASMCSKNIQNFLNKYLAKGTVGVSCGSHCTSKERESAEMVAIFHLATPVCRSPLARLNLSAYKSNSKFNTLMLACIIPVLPSCNDPCLQWM